MVDKKHYPAWLQSLCDCADSSKSYYVYHLECDFNYPSRKNIPFFIKWKYKKLFKIKNKTDKEWLECAQVATKFYLKSDIFFKRILYDSTTDFFIYIN